MAGGKVTRQSAPGASDALTEVPASVRLHDREGYQRFGAEVEWAIYPDRLAQDLAVAPTRTKPTESRLRLPVSGEPGPTALVSSRPGRNDAGGRAHRSDCSDQADHLLEGGLLQEVEWGIPGEPDVRGKRTFTYTMLDALIEQRPALDRGTLSTDRADNTVLVILDPLAITDEHLFSMG